MSNERPSYGQLERRLAEAEEVVEVLRRHEVDAVVGEKSVSVVRLRHVEQQLARARRTAEMRAEELEAFSHSITHELRNSINNIGSMVEILRDQYGDALDDDGRTCLRLIDKDTHRMAETIAALRRLCGVVQQSVQLVEIDLGAMARDIVSQLRQASPRRTVKTVIADNMKVRGDEHLARLVLENLVRNAWKYTGNMEHARIEIGERSVDGQREFFVKDNGAGFDMSQAETIFGEFNRAHKSDAFGGTGVGLSIARRAVRRHGGTIRAEGEPGRGATFSFTLAPEAASRERRGIR